MQPNPSYSPPSPWMNLEDLNQIFMQTPEQNASFDPSLGAQPSTVPLQAPKPEPEYLHDQPFGPMAGSGGASHSQTAVRPESLAMWNQLINKQSEGLGMEKKGLEELSKRRTAIENQPQEMNYMGLMALADAWGTDKSNFAGNYKQPTTPEDKAKMMFELENHIQKAKQGYTDDEVKLMKSKLDAAIMKETKADAATGKKSDAVNKLGNEVVKAYNNDHVVKKYAAAQEAAGQVLDLLNSNNPLADNSIPTFVARASGEVGNLSEADKKPFGGSGALTAKLAATAKQLAEGRITDENRAFIAQLSDTMSKHAQEVQDKRARMLSEQYGRANSNVGPQDVLGVIAPHLEYQPLEKGHRFETTADKGMGKHIFKEGDMREKNGVMYKRGKNPTDWTPVGDQ